MSEKAVRRMLKIEIRDLTLEMKEKGWDTGVIEIPEQPHLRAGKFVVRKADAPH